MALSVLRTRALHPEGLGRVRPVLARLLLRPAGAVPARQPRPGPGGLRRRNGARADHPVLTGSVMAWLGGLVPDGAFLDQTRWYFTLWAILGTVLVVAMVWLTAASRPRTASAGGAGRPEPGPAADRDGVLRPVRGGPGQRRDLGLEPAPARGRRGLAGAGRDGSDLSAAGPAGAGAARPARRTPGRRAVARSLAAARRRGRGPAALPAWATRRRSCAPPTCWWDSAAGLGSLWMLPQLLGAPLPTSATTATCRSSRWCSPLGAGAVFALGTPRRPDAGRGVARPRGAGPAHRQGLPRPVLAVAGPPGRAVRAALARPPHLGRRRGAALRRRLALRRRAVHARPRPARRLVCRVPRRPRGRRRLPRLAGVAHRRRPARRGSDPARGRTGALERTGARAIPGSSRIRGGRTRRIFRGPARRRRSTSSRASSPGPTTGSSSVSPDRDLWTSDSAMSPGPGTLVQFPPRLAQPVSPGGSHCNPPVTERP